MCTDRNASECTDFEEEIQVVLEAIKTFVNEGMWGELNIKFKNGSVVAVEEKKTIKVG